MALLPPLFLDAVVCIGVPSAAGTNWIGTGFLLGRPFKENTLHIYVITNKHVVANKTDLVLRFSSTSGVQDFPISFSATGSQQWTLHPSPEVDVAVLRVDGNSIHGAGALFQVIESKNSFTVAEMRAEGVCEGDSIFVLGFPLGIVGKDRKNAIARSGIIARIKDVLEGKDTSFLIDANVFPGNSGGPVILRPEIAALNGTKAHSHAMLIGMVKSYVTFRDVAVSKQTGNERVIFEENSGLALVETIDSIREAIEIQFAQYPAQ